jgi:hypothetical protein
MNISARAVFIVSNIIPVQGSGNGLRSYRRWIGQAIGKPGPSSLRQQTVYA